MRKKSSVKQLPTRILGGLVLSFSLLLLVDCYALWTQETHSLSRFWVEFAGLTVLFIFLFRKSPRVLLKVSLLFLGCICAAFLAVTVLWQQFYSSSVFPSIDDGKQQLYGGKRVMVIVPHEDDELNLVSGVLNEYVRYGSQVYPVFVTNGDYYGNAETRMKEALSVLEQIGIPSENTIFLGYGDKYQEDGPHIYNAEPEQVLTSHIGYNTTYGTSAHAAYREGRSYTSDHFLEDIHDVIWEYRPDVLFCSEHEEHPDHKAVSLAFDKVMGQLLKEHPNYHPLVFKGCTYASAWHAASDFFAINILSTQSSGETPTVYHWEDRVRLPVWDGSLAHSLIRCETAQELALYSSQGAYDRADSIVNGDKVFWSRDTGSLCYQADIQVSSGNGSLLNDFMLLDNKDVTEKHRIPADGTWVPTDTEKIASVTFPEPQDIDCIRLYDNPSADDNVLRCAITFSDGSTLECGPLPPQGAALTVPVRKIGITNFSIRLIETEGDNAGLTEIEAFSTPPTPGLRYIKLMDAQEDFMYDYCMAGNDTLTIQTYCVGLTNDEQLNLTVHVDNSDCSASIQDGIITLTCPKGSSTVLTVQLEGTDLSDAVRIRHPGSLTRRFQTGMRLLDEALYPRYIDYLNNPESFLRHSAVCSLFMPLLNQM